MAELKKVACEAIDKVSSELNDISQELWKNPELNFNEHHAHTILTDFLENQGFTVDRKYKLDTAFRATFGDESAGPHVAVLCEYDALPEIGHACGHNLIAELGVAAGVGIKTAMEASEQPIGKITIMGTPDEENRGGKLDLLQKGAFQKFDVAMMSHPAPNDSVLANMLAVDWVTVTYKGKASHAAAFPWEGVNALDAAVTCYQTVSCMRQQMKPTWRVHGIITKGGLRPNIIPEEAALEYYIRAPNKAELHMLREKIMNCFESAATATGCKVEYNFSEMPYLNVISNEALASSFEANARELGLDFKEHGMSTDSAPLGSTDMGNVSYVVPSIHPFFYIGTDEVNHTRGFTEATGAPAAQPYTILQGKAMAMTAIDVFTNNDLLHRIKTEFDNEPQRKA
ncbi:peptidase M20 domain-containing protein 2-like isoform X2 [Ylistrum balloti]|uniref:peptidase M20 domain-containing protein 2-like isoform X2 n=1 Tax=Ylistrum balloti TaxID=509963 RepID=UPI002905CCB9|nr:peptidase M20 domain-containing protein 2-like isoform X2 [Ylistrum balloti]